MAMPWLGPGASPAGAIAAGRQAKRHAKRGRISRRRMKNSLGAETGFRKLEAIRLSSKEMPAF
jgi:hypothetical protein